MIRITQHLASSAIHSLAEAFHMIYDVPIRPKNKFGICKLHLTRLCLKHFEEFFRKETSTNIEDIQDAEVTYGTKGYNGHCRLGHLFQLCRLLHGLLLFG